MSKKSILLVEDEERLRQILSKILTMFNYGVFEANSGNEALSLIESNSHAIDLLISDINMPNMSGIELYEKIKSIKPELRCVMTTGYLDDDEKLELDKLGVLGVIYKPFQVEEVLQVVETSILK